MKRGVPGYDKMLDYLRASNYNKLANDAEHAYVRMVVRLFRFRCCGPVWFSALWF